MATHYARNARKIALSRNAVKYDKNSLIFKPGVQQDLRHKILKVRFCPPLTIALIPG